MSKKVAWTFRAQKSLDAYCSIIHENSPANAKRVRKEIILTSKRLSKNANLFQLDE